MRISRTAAASLAATEIIKIACGIEQNGYIFYTSAAHSSPTAATRKLFASLAQQEQAHWAYFAGMFYEFATSGEKSRQQLKSHATPENRALRLKVNRRLQAGTPNPVRALDQMERGLEVVIQLARRAEKESVDFYTKLLVHADFEKSRSVLRRIIQQEKAHMINLTRIQHYFTKNR